MVEATHYVNSKEYTLALKKYEELITKYPKSILVPTASFNMAIIYLNNNSSALALAKFERILKEFPNSDSAQLSASKISELKKIKKSVIIL